MKHIIIFALLISCISLSAQNVGVNKTNPEYTLDVRSTNIGDASQINLSNPDKSRYLRFFSGNDAFPDPSMIWNPGHNFLFATFDDVTFNFTEYMRIDSLGVITTPELDISEITDVKALITKEYYDNKTTFGLEAINEGNSYGYRIKGRNPDNFGTIGLEAVDLTFSSISSTTLGATGFFAFAAGYETTASGNYATAINLGSEASGLNSIAMGVNSIASATSAMAFGAVSEANSLSATAIGNSSVASGDYSVTLGRNSIANGNNSITGGRFSVASGDDSVAIGKGAESAGTSSIALGEETTALGGNSIAIGNYAYAGQVNSIAIGSSSVSTGNNSVSIGDNEASGGSSTALGIATTASGFASTAMGNTTTASNEMSTALGASTTASGLYSTAMGFGSEASGSISTALGFQTDASGSSAVSMGYQTTASGDQSTASGRSTIASGDRSNAMGNSTTARSFAETVVGTYNADYTPNSTSSWNRNDRVFAVGVGSSASFRRNALTVLKSGNVGVGTDNPEELLHIVGRMRIGTETIEDTGLDQLSFNASLLPDVDNAMTLGNASWRWSGVWANDGTINTSDRREKKNIKDLSYGLTEVLQMQPVSFNWKDSNNPDLKLGLIA